MHQLGLDQAKEITARIDALLQAQGMTQGTVGAAHRGALQGPEVSSIPTPMPARREEIAYCNQRLAEIKPQLPAVFNRLPPYSSRCGACRRRPKPGAASAFSQAPALDGSRPGIVYFNLHDSAEWPKLALSTTVFHEGLPGHQLEGGLALSNTNLPLIRKTIGFSGYAEGWALYAEQLADEIGMYDDDPLGRIGYLKFQLFRANRCVVDTGIHHLRWTREQAIQYFVDSDGDAPGFATREVERYCATPGQACSYKIGHTVWTKARERAKAALGRTLRHQGLPRRRPRLRPRAAGRPGRRASTATSPPQGPAELRSAWVEHCRFAARWAGQYASPERGRICRAGWHGAEWR